jgi:hypothetical protein
MDEAESLAGPAPPPSGDEERYCRLYFVSFFLNSIKQVQLISFLKIAASFVVKTDITLACTVGCSDFDPGSALLTSNVQFVHVFFILVN